MTRVLGNEHLLLTPGASYDCVPSLSPPTPTSGATYWARSGQCRWAGSTAGPHRERQTNDQQSAKHHSETVPAVMCNVRVMQAGVWAWGGRYRAPNKGSVGTEPGVAQVNNRLQAAGPGMPQHEDRRESVGNWDGWNGGCMWGQGGRCNWTDASRRGGGVNRLRSLDFIQREMNNLGGLRC